MNNPQILVTGGAGFIGSNFVRYAIKGGARVITFDALSYAGNLANLASVESNRNHTFVHGSICDGSLVEETLKKFRPDAIVHLAAESHVDRSIDGPRSFLENNVIGTFELLEATREYLKTLPQNIMKRFRFLHVSTDEVFGSIKNGAFKETSAYSPNSPYAASKASSDHLVRSFFATYEFPAIITNCSNNYGPHQFPEKLIPTIILNALEGSKIPIFGDGLQVRDWLFVEDHCTALMQVLQSGQLGTSYNISGGSTLTNLEIVRRVCTLLDRFKPLPGAKSYMQFIEHVADRPGHDRRYSVDSSKIMAELGWRPAIELASGLEQTVYWYLNNSEWWEPLRQTRLGRSPLSNNPLIQATPN